ncbi:polysaccharide deacetylase family protein [Parasphingorhabdus sp. DH2-15]|uniref:polysaccharide deacetylase family protein n=1 Tax=Parasphingorhabdus sp. DH2-15 TaxID=3444112 RepID=UPI003F686804
MHFIINFHGIGAPVRAFEYGEEPYWISRDFFTDILDMLQRQPRPFAISFDDGNNSDYAIAVPELQQRRLKADFFVLAGKLNQPGYLTSDQVRIIDNDDLFTIGSHGLHHQPWPDLDKDEMQREITASRAILSDLCNRPIVDAGLPFGRYNRNVMRSLQNAGYKRIYSSDGGQRVITTNPIPRFSVRNDTALSDLADTLNNSAHISQRIRNEVKARIKALI